MQANLLSIVSLMAFISCSRCGDNVRLYSFGPKVGDLSLKSGINPGAIIDLKESYPVFGRQFAKIYISDNGYVTLNDPVLTISPTPFPIKSGSFRSRISTMIAPYWSDVSMRCYDGNQGQVYYRQLRVFPSSDLDTMIQKEVSFVSDVIFKPTSVLIVTWKGVKSSDCYDERNTFQLVLTTDGTRTFAMFRYKSLQWHTSYKSARGPAAAGVNAFYAGDYSRPVGFNVDNDPASIIEYRLLSMSNANNVPGLFVYALN